MRLKKAVQFRNSRAKIALYICEHFEDALSAILVGNNPVKIVAAYISAVISMASKAAASVFYKKHGYEKIMQHEMYLHL